MPRRALKCCSIAVFLLVALPAIAQQKWVEGELLVKFRGGPNGVAAARAEQALGYDVRRRFGRVGWQHVRVRPGQTQADVLARLRQRPDVIAAEPNYVFELREAETNPVPNDPNFRDQWALTKIGATNAWALSSGSSNVVVAVLDTGIRYTHEDLAANMWRNPGEIPGNMVDDDGNGYVDDVFGIDAASQDSDPIDQPVGISYHGTACASIIGAVGNNGRGIAGVNWSVQLMALRLAATSNYIASAWAAECFEYVLMMRERGVNVRVTSNSYGLDDAPSQAVRDAIAAAGDAGILNVFAAGNARRNVDVVPDYPSCFDVPAIINVAATDINDALAGFSNYGATNVDLAAPGVGIWVADGFSVNGYNGSFTGTSAACPYVAGAAALIASAYPAATTTQIKTALMESVDLLPALNNAMVAPGRLNVSRAITHPGLVIGAPPHVVIQPLSATNGVGYAQTFCVAATGAAPIDYFWHFNGNQIAHTTEPAFTRSNLTSGDAGGYSVVLSNAFGTATSAVATLTIVTEPTIWSEPQSIRVLDGTNIFFRVGAAGAFPLTYQWQRNGINMPDETNATLPFLNAQSAMSGDYRVRLSNSHGAATTSVARLTVLTRPHFVIQPQSQTVAVGANVSLSAAVTNSATLPIGYRWRRPVLGAWTVSTEFTSETNLFNIQTNLAGIWSILATNEGPAGISTIFSSNAYVTVVVPPTNQMILMGANATFRVTGAGTPPLRYQWQREGSNLVNATNTTLTLTNVQPSDAGSYSVLVINAVGHATPFSATLQVGGPPLLTQAELLADGTFRAVVTGLVPGQSYRVEDSTNLTDWQTWGPFTAPGTSTSFTVEMLPQTTRKFFRARTSPP